MLARKTFTGFPRRAFGALILLSPVVPQHNLIFPFCSFTIMKAWTHSKHLISKIFLCHVAIFPHHDIMIFPHPCPTLTCSWCWWRGAGWWSPWHLSWWADPAYPPTFSQTYLVVVVVSVLGHTNIFASIPSSLSIGPLTSLLCHHVWDNVDRDGEDNLMTVAQPFFFYHHPPCCCVLRIYCSGFAGTSAEKMIQYGSWKGVTLLLYGRYGFLLLDRFLYVLCVKYDFC